MADTDMKKSLVQFFLDQFNVEISSTSEDLIDAGILDSLMLIEVVMFMEREFSVTTEPGRFGDGELPDHRQHGAVRG
jgi:acyl carrier protein